MTRRSLPMVTAHFVYPSGIQNRETALPESLSHYRILKQLGAGGMGRVFLAEDSRLHRKVAIKLLPPELTGDANARQRLLREARAAAAVDHPNVCAVYDAGEDGDVVYIAMQYLQGETLADRIARGPVPLPDALDITIAVCNGLAEAHRHGIIHRDLKPQNVMITIRGDVRVVDFGLAKDLTPANDDAATDVAVSEAGKPSGTLLYMSPEQLRCEPLDSRSDIFSVGIVLYELLSGVRPFGGKSTADVISHILNGKPAPLRHPSRSIGHILDRCLAKERDARYATIENLLQDLTEARRTIDSGDAVVALGRRERKKTAPSIAVLPFENATADPQNDYLVDGITESVIYRLSELPGLRVMARSTVFRFRGKDIDPLQAGRQLGVASIISGRVATRGDRLAIDAELIDTRDGAQLWGQRFERDLAGIQEAQTEIAGAISDHLRVKLSASQKKRLKKQHEIDPEAYRLYLHGRFWWNKRPQEGFVRALDFFQQAIERDPLFALAYSGIADACASLGSWESGFMPPRDAMPRAKAAARRAIEIDDQIADAYASLGYILLHYDWSWEESQKAFARAIELNPNCVNAHHWLSHLHTATRNPDQSLDESRKTADLDPLDLIANVHLAWHYWLAREPGRVIEQSRKTATLEPNSFWPPFFEGLGHELRSDLDSAAEKFRQARERAPRTTFAAAALAHVLARKGARNEALAILDDLERIAADRYLPAYDRAIIYLGMGDIDRTYEWLDRTFDERSGWLAYLRVEPRLDPIRSDPRFNNLCERVGLR